MDGTTDDGGTSLLLDLGAWLHWVATSTPLWREELDGRGVVGHAAQHWHALAGGFRAPQTILLDSGPDVAALPRPLSDDLRRKLKLIAETLGYQWLTHESARAIDMAASILSAQSPDSSFYLWTRDRRWLQFLDARVRVACAAGDLEDRNAHFWSDVHPHQYPDYLAIIGWKSLTVKGVRGLGDKAARHLLREHGSVDRMLEHRSEADNRIATVCDHAEQLRLDLQRLRASADRCPALMPSGRTPPPVDSAIVELMHWEMRGLTARRVIRRQFVREKVKQHTPLRRHRAFCSPMTPTSCFVSENGPSPTLERPTII